MEELIERAANDILKAKKVVALTGAGMSVESGIPPFRGKGGIWEKYDPEEYANISTFMRNPGKSWILLKEMLKEIKKAKPNPGHLGLAELERMGHLDCIITQNVDGLHHVAGNTDVIEFHGNNRLLVCLDCGKKYSVDEISLDEIPPQCTNCGGNRVKPDAVFFGEPIPIDALQRSYEESKRCQVMLVIGTSAVVYPAASMPEVAKRSGATVIEINPERTSFTHTISDYLIKGKAGEVMPLIVDAVKALPKTG
jgi:NAD-dependent deacetylase